MLHQFLYFCTVDGRGDIGTCRSWFTYCKLNGHIVTTTREQTSANLEIVERLQSVQSIAQNTADDVETLARSSERLPPIAVRLDALGRRFHP